MRNTTVLSSLGLCLSVISQGVSVFAQPIAVPVPETLPEPALPTAPTAPARQPTHTEGHSHENAQGHTHTHTHEAPGAGAGALVVSPDDDEAVVHGERALTAASDATVRGRDLELRPRTRPADLFEVAPGLVVVQHAGGGKANQYFLRGFDADHGTDIAFSLDGVPFNNPSHGHGQGYTDPHFIIPELVERVVVHEGPYSALDGDFATAGSVQLHYLPRVRQSSVSLEGGMYNHARLLGIVRTESGRLTGYAAAELATDDGPFRNPLAYQRTNLVGRWTYRLADHAHITLSAMAYGGAWNASGQVPSRLTDNPNSGFTRFDAVDPTEGGQSTRQSVGLEFHTHLGDQGSFDANAYLVRYRLNLFSNFTFFANDPERGDQIEQSDSRTITGFRAAWRKTLRVRSWTFETVAGFQLRADFIDNALHSALARQRLGTRVHANIQESSVGVFAEEQLIPARWIRLVLGLRGDLFDFAVDDLRTGLIAPDPNANGVRQAALVSPKATLVLSPLRWLELYANFGTGFHSNDARGVIRRASAVTPLARGLGAELGARARAARRLDVAVSAWVLDLQSEIVFVGDEGSTEARGPSRRVGLTGEFRWSIFAWLRADLDVSLSNASFRERPLESNAVPLAPTMVLSAGLAGRHPSGLFGSIRLRAVGDRPANEDRSLTAQGFAILSAQVGYRKSFWELALQAENLLDSTWREAQFATDSRLRTECTTPGAPGCSAPSVAQRFGAVSDVNFTPGTPFAAQLRLTLYLDGQR